MGADEEVIVVFKLVTGRAVRTVFGIVSVNMMACGEEVVNKFKVKMRSVRVATTKVAKRSPVN